MLLPQVPPLQTLVPLARPSLQSPPRRSHHAVELMWRPEEHPSGNKNGQDAHMVVSSSSSSSSSSRSPFTSHTVSQTPGRAMEEVWKDVALSTAYPTLDHGSYRQPCSYHHQPSATCHSPITSTDLSQLRGMILPDFLARPFKGTNASASSAPTAPATGAEEQGDRHNETGSLGSRLTQPPPRSSPATVLTLNSGVDFQHMDAVMAPGCRHGSFPDVQSHSNGQQRHSATHHSHASSSSSIAAAVFSDSLGSPGSGIFSMCDNKKRALEQQQLENSDGSAGDHRHKRMIKNRESAARSRARKQAYTNELEIEVDRLTEENESLRRQHEELRAKMAAQLPKKKAIQRSSTAPF